MPRRILPDFARFMRPIMMLGAMSVVVACAATPPQNHGITDPHETDNRRIHEFNRDMDRAIIKPAAKGYGKVAGEDVKVVVGNFAGNFDLPSTVVNRVLQGEMKEAGRMTLRFLVNSTMGIGGLFDPASEMGLAKNDTDFGETLHVWGMKEGAYTELPLLGPSTQRDDLGMIVDLATNPLTYGLKGSEALIGPVAKGLKKLGDRDTYADTVDAVLYESADSYAQARSLYLQNRRHQLGDEESVTDSEAYEDPYDF